MTAYKHLIDLQNKMNGPMGSLDRPTALNRYSGGHKRHNQPYVSGYWYLLMEPPRELLGDAMQADSKSWLHTTAESFTPPTKTVTKADVPGMGGFASSFVAGQELSRTFTVAFREYQGLPIMNILQAWTNAIDSRSGVSPLPTFIPSEYKGSAFAALCKPTMNDSGVILSDDIEQLFYFEGVFPETLPYDTLTSDISTNDTAQLSVTFSFDGWPATRENDLAMNKFTSLMSDNGFTYNDISNKLDTIDPSSSLFSGQVNSASVIK